MQDLKWWQRGVIYHVYPRSFQDSNGDGIGDLPGIRRRLDYLADLGVDDLWISPFYPSLVADVHARGMKLIVDFVPNHTSSSHPWFLESRRSRDNPKRDWYLWRDPA